MSNYAASRRSPATRAKAIKKGRKPNEPHDEFGERLRAGYDTDQLREVWPVLGIAVGMAGLLVWLGWQVTRREAPDSRKR